MALEENLQKSVLSEATLHYRRNIFLLLSVASLVWFYGDLVDYVKLAPLKTEVGPRIIKEVVLYTLLGGFLFNGTIYCAYAEREIREWKSSVIGGEGVQSSSDRRLPIFYMYISDRIIVSG